jgi:hypothetical protein
MLDRSKLGRALSAAFVVLGLLPVAAGHAATRPVTRPVPADAPTVATTPSGAAVIAWVVGGRTCTILQEAGQPRPDTLSERSDGSDAGSPDGECVATRALSQFHADQIDSTFIPPQAISWGIAGPGVARLEIRGGGKVIAASAAASASLPGPAAALRFWAVETPTAGVAADEVAVLDAAGTVRRAWDPEDFGFFASGDDEPGAPSGALLRRGAFPGGQWQLRHVTRQRLAPTPLEPEHRVPEHCLALSFTSSGSRGSSYGPCDDALLDRSALLVQQGFACQIGAYLEVLVRAPVRAVVVVLGDGTRRTVPLAALTGTAGTRGGAFVVGSGMAIRRVVGLGAGGRAVRTWPVGSPPVSVRESCEGTSFSDLSFVTSGADDLLGAGPHALHVVDFGDQLCVAIDRAPRVPPECGLPPVDPEGTSLSVTKAATGQYVNGLVPVEVAAVRVTLDDRSTRTVPVTPIPGYTGRYAAVIGQVALDVPAPRRALTAVLLDARGRVLGTSRVLASLETTVGRRSTLRPAAGGLPALEATAVGISLGRRTYDFTCVTLGAWRDFDDCLLALRAGDVGAKTVQVIARCAPRRLVVFAVLRHRTDRLVVRTRGGRTITAGGDLRLAAGSGPAAGHYVALVVLDPREAVAGLRVRGSSPRRLAASYPAAAAQCGYADQPADRLPDGV